MSFLVEVDYKELKDISAPEYRFVRSVIPDLIEKISPKLLKKELLVMGTGRVFWEIFSSKKADGSQIGAISDELNEYLDKTLNTLSDLTIYTNENGELVIKLEKEPVFFYPENGSWLGAFLIAGAPIKAVAVLYNLDKGKPPSLPVRLTEENIKDEYYKIAQNCDLDANYFLIERLGQRMVSGKLFDFELAWIEKGLSQSNLDIKTVKIVHKAGLTLRKSTVEESFKKAISNSNTPLWKKRLLAILYLSAKGEVNENLLIQSYKLLQKLKVQGKNILNFVQGETLSLTDGKVNGVLDGSIVSSHGVIDVYNYAIKRKKPKVRSIL